MTVDHERQGLNGDGSDMTWTVILPCAAPVAPPPARRPKWLMTSATGELMLQLAAASVPSKNIGDIVVAFLRETDETYQCAEALRRAFDGRVRCVILEERTAGPAETVRLVIERAGLTGPICIKDSDSFFSLNALPETSFVAVSDISTRQRLSNPGRKSYVRVNEQGMVDDIVEKNIISNLVSCGLYGFVDPGVFTTEFDRMARLLGHKRLFVSHVLASAVLHGQVCLPVHCSDYVDLETNEDLTEYRSDFATLLLDIDGVVFRNQSRFFRPFWGDPVDPIAENIEHIRGLQERGAQLIFVTARPENLRAATMEALESVGLRVHALVMGCHHGTRFLVNDYAHSNPYPSAVAVNIERNRPTLHDLLLSNRPPPARDL